MLPVIPDGHGIRTMSAGAIDMVRRLEAEVLKAPQVEMVTRHVLHAGMYLRTITLPAGCVMTGVLVKIATALIVSGDATVYTEDGPERLRGYNVLPAAAGRKQAFLAHAETHITMAFPTSATTVQQAEEEFTDEYHLLASRSGRNEIHVGGFS